MSGEHLQTFTDDNFSAEILNYKGVAVVDFWAEWCGPCKMLGPTIEVLADEYAGKVKVGKMNVDDNTNTPQQFKIRGIPTVIVFKNGSAVQQIVGVQPKEVFVEAITKNL